MNGKIKFYIGLTILWICFIFSFSLQPAAVSSTMSNAVGQVIVDNASTEASEKFDEMTYSEWKEFSKVVRKSGHFIEFFVLGVLMYLTVSQTTWRYKLLGALGLCVLVATMDECIQLFVDGRSAQVTDVLIDSCGAFVGIILIKVTRWLLAGVYNAKIKA